MPFILESFNSRKPPCLIKRWDVFLESTVFLLFRFWVMTRWQHFCAQFPAQHRSHFDDFFLPAAAATSYLRHLPLVTSFVASPLFFSFKFFLCNIFPNFFFSVFYSFLDHRRSFYPLSNSHVTTTFTFHSFVVTAHENLPMIYNHLSEYFFEFSIFSSLRFGQPLPLTMQHQIMRW